MKKFTFALMAILSLSIATFAQITVTASGKTVGGSPNQVDVNINSTYRIQGVSKSMLEAQFGKLASVIVNTQSFENALRNKSCPVPARPNLPTSVDVTVSEGAQMKETPVSGKATVYGARCKTGSCGSRRYKKTFDMNGTLKVEFNGVSDQDIAQAFDKLVAVGTPHVAYYNQLVTALNTCNIAPPAKTEVVAEVIEDATFKAKQKCSQKWWKPVVAGGAGAVAGYYIAKDGRRKVGAIIGAGAGAGSQILLCKAGVNTLGSILGGIGIGGAASTITYINWFNRNPPVDGPDAPIRVPNCPVGQVCGDTGNPYTPPTTGPNAPVRVPNGNPVVINNNGIGGNTNNTNRRYSGGLFGGGNTTSNSTNRVSSNGGIFSGQVNTTTRTNTNRAGQTVVTVVEPSAPSGTAVQIGNTGLSSSSRNTTVVNTSQNVQSQRTQQTVLQVTAPVVQTTTRTTTTNAPRRAGS